MVQRQRQRDTIAFTGTYYGDNGAWVDSGTYNLYNSESCTDAEHDVSLLGKGGDIGGTFDLIRSRTYASPGHVDIRPLGYNIYGDVVPSHMYVDDSSEISQVPTNSELGLQALGTTAIARVTPTNPSFSLAYSLGEIRNDGLPRLPGSIMRDKSNFLRNSGSEYLNAEFGWIPMVSDLVNFAKTVKKSDAIISQYRKQSDSRIRRRYPFPTTEITKTFSTGDGRGGNVVPLPGNLLIAGGLGVGVQTTAVQNRTAFSGAFRYHVPTGDSFDSKLAVWSSNADKLLGVRLTPELVYNLTPWTWALDWFSNTGDVMHNISQLGHDGLVLEWGYIMEGYKLTRDISGTFPHLNSSVGGGRASVTYETVKLKRRSSTPFGFGFDLGSLTGSQDAILVALGLSRGIR